ncbi:DUF6460 domain-containing protein [Salinarimonas soli]|uniref:Integrase n=1 Tax=Salinarimonas soli TaxID=1638099 RepID=A0A5B2VEP1_9HYPH|nr:DUF6460 domain-containing protein [Salinarimonas soli]KAA2237295.1 integrase [Salinarimonas soli]
MASNLQRFLGGSPGAVLVKLVFLSLLVGAFMSFLGLTPVGLVDGVVRLARSVLDLGFDTFAQIWRWLAYGAVVVVPLWLLSRLLSSRRP